MVDISDKCLAMYPDNDWQTHKGGTCECMRYANSKGLPLVQIGYHMENDVLLLDKLFQSKMETGVTKNKQEQEYGEQAF